ncbi:uncharacterized protein, partial [Rutidosis leptorrhynchoides]|uniref:uncharacterized protein n=1 Tax=Rutidosis leptorrhynchoides TaxID=125765 RepID=UPI003A98F310
MTYIDPVCSVCGMRDESILHLFRDCIWSRLKDDLLIIFVLAAYWIWMNRNKVVFESVCERPVSSMNGIQQWRDNLLWLDLIAVRPVSSPNTSAVKWCPPSPSVVKINFDASFVYGANTNCYGVMARNSQGSVIETEWGRLDYIEDAFHVETCAARKAIQLATRLGFDQILLEGDQIQQFSFNYTGRSYTSSGVLIDEIKTLASSFNSVSYNFVKRNANKVADSIAHLQFNCVSKRFNEASVPPIIEYDLFTHFVNQPFAIG